jgi:Amidohydrolase family
LSVLTEGRKRGLSLERAAKLLATNPAKIAGFWPRKGKIRIGSDADLILVNLEHNWTLEPEMLHSKHQPGLTHMDDFDGIDVKFHLEGRANSMFALMWLRFRNKILVSLKAICVSPETSTLSVCRARVFRVP